MRILLIQRLLESRGNYIIRGSGNLCKRSRDLGVIEQAMEWLYFDHFEGSLFFTTFTERGASFYFKE